MVNNNRILRYADAVAWDSRAVPPSLHIALTDQCWNQCKICGHWERKDKTDIDINELSQFITECEKHNLETVCFTGGDPLRYSCFNRIAHMCSEWGIDYGIVTAGWKPSWINMDTLRRARWVRCSIDAVGEEHYRAVRGGSLRWKTLEASLNKMAAEGVNLQVFTTISKHNVNYLADLYSWLYDNRYMFSEFRARPAYKHGGCSDSVNSVQVMKILGRYQQELDNAELVQRQFTPVPFEHCQAVKYQWFISAKGNIYPCCITAGDTESASRVEPIGHITDGIGNLYNAALQWSCIGYDSLPDVCRKECVPRFNAINTMLTNDYLLEKNFF